MSPIAFQDLIPDNLCYGCGPHNHDALRIKSFWEGEEWKTAPSGQHPTSGASRPT